MEESFQEGTANNHQHQLTADDSASLPTSFSQYKKGKNQSYDQAYVRRGNGDQRYNGGGAKNNQNNYHAKRPRVQSATGGFDRRSSSGQLSFQDPWKPIIEQLCSTRKLPPSELAKDYSFA